MKLLKAFIWVICLLGIVAITTASFLMVGVDPNSYKPELSKLAKENGVDLAIDGDLSWSFFPNLAVNAGATSISGKNIPEIHFEQADFSLDWMALLSSTVRLKTISIYGADITIQATAEAENIVVASTKITSTKKQDTSIPALPFELAIDGLNLKNAKLTVVSAAQQKTVVEKLNLTGKNLNLDEKPFSIGLQFSTIHPDYPIPIDVTFSSQIIFHEKEKMIALESTKLSVNGIENLPIALSFNASYQLEKLLTLDNIKFNSDDFTINGDASLKLTSPRKLNIKLRGTDLILPTALQKIDQKATNGQPSNHKGSAAQALLSPIVAPLALLEGGKGHIEISLDSFSVDQIIISKLHLNLFSNNKVIEITDLSGEVFDGVFQATTRIDLSSNMPRIEFSNTLKDININKALSSLADLSDISGTLSADFSATSRGDTQDILIDNMHGAGELLAENLKLNIINVEQSYCEMASIIEKRALSSQSWPNYTELQSLKTKFSLDNKIVTIPSLTSGLGNLAISGDGQVNLKEQTYSVLIKANLKGDQTSESGCPIKSKSIRNKDLPLRCSGSFAPDGSTKCLPEKGFIKQLLKETIKEKLINSLLNSKSDAGAEKSGGTEPKDVKEQIMDTLLKGLFK